MKGDIPKWDASGKRFSVEDVNRILKALDAVADKSGEPNCSGSITQAIESTSVGEYIMPFPGRSVTVRRT